MKPGSFVVHIVDDDEAVRQSLAFLLSTAGIPIRVMIQQHPSLHPWRRCRTAA
jgi:FixJ family two-component response regulator